MSEPPTDTDHLLDRVAAGDDRARNRLLDRHRQRLRQLIALRMDRRLQPRLDPSDVVQDSLAEADRRLHVYLAARPVPFYAWLRQLALERLTEAHRRHVGAQRRSVLREISPRDLLPDESLHELADRLVSAGSSPSAAVQRDEVRQQVRTLLLLLSEPDRELLVLRHLEHLSTREIAAVLGVSEAAVKVRHVRALDRLRRMLGRPQEDGI